MHMPGLIGWFALSVGIALASLVPYRWYSRCHSTACLVGTCLLISAFVLIRRPLLRLVPLLLCGALVLAAGRGEQVRLYQEYTTTVADTSPQFLSGRVVSVPLRRGRFYSYLVRCDSLFVSGRAAILEGKLVRCLSRSLPEYGRRILARGVFQPPRLPVMPGTFDEYRYSMARDVWGTFRADGHLKRLASLPLGLALSAKVRNNIYTTLEHLDHDGHRALLQAAFLGERAVPAELKATFKRAGISHLLAISGLHLGMLVGALMLALGMLPLSRRVKHPVIIVCIWGYVGLIGPLPSLVRAAVMVTVLLLGTCIQRPSRTLNALGTAGLLWLLLSPESLFTPGYQLSFAATFGIVALVGFAKRHTYRWAWVEAGVLRPVAEAFFVSLAAFVATCPILAWHFGELSLFGIIANVFVVFLMTGCMAAFFVALLLQPLCAPAAAGAVGLSNALLHGVTGIAGLARWVPPLRVNSPPPLLVLLYAVCVVALTSICWQRLRKALRVSTPVVALLVPAILIADRALMPAECRIVDTGSDRIVTYGVAARPDVWVFASRSEALDDRMVTCVLLPWARRLRRTPRYLVCEQPVSTDEKERLKESFGRTDVRIAHGDVPGAPREFRSLVNRDNGQKDDGPVCSLVSNTVDRTRKKTTVTPSSEGFRRRPFTGWASVSNPYDGHPLFRGPDRKSRGSRAAGL